MMQRGHEPPPGDQAFVVPNLGFALFERAWSLRGFEPLLLDLAADPAYVAELLDRITFIQLVLIGRYLEAGVDGGYFGDDYGAQTGLLFSPATWRALVKPRLARLFAPFVERGLPVLMHSDGAIGDIIPDLVEIGLTALNPVQPEVLDHAWLRDTVRRPARLLRWHLDADGAAARHPRPGARRRGGLPGRPGARRHGPAPRAVAPAHDGYPDAQRRSAAGRVRRGPLSS